jgi:NodT family efflux transporter outer membrane factor (OMF) lipoprotein
MLFMSSAFSPWWSGLSRYFLNLPRSGPLNGVFPVSQIISRRLLFASCAVLTLSGCMVGPNFAPPHAAEPGSFTEQPAAHGGNFATTDPVNPEWWTSFNDPELTALEAKAVAQNLDVQIATERFMEAEAQAQIDGAVLYPSLNGAGSYTHEKPSGEGVFGLFGGSGGASTDAGSVANGSSSAAGGGGVQAAIGPIDIYQYGLQAKYDLDLWGKNRRTAEAAVAHARSSEEARRAALLNVQTAVATNYIELRGGEALITITEKNLDAANQLVQLTSERQAAGLTTSLDVANAKATAASIQSQLPTLIAQRDALIGQIGLLLGATPDGLPVELVTTAPVPLTPPDVPVGLPSQLLTRRPDVRESLQDLHQATAEVGVAEAQFYPDINLSASASLQALQFKNLNEWSALTYAMGPDISLPLFAGGQLRGQLKLNKAEQREAAVNYAKTVLTAFTQVNTALANYAQEHDTLAALNVDVQQSDVAFGLAQDQYKQGLADYLSVLNAQEQYLQAQQNQVQSIQRLGTDLVNLYQALGGGWEQEYPAKA